MALLMLQNMAMLLPSPSNGNNFKAAIAAFFILNGNRCVVLVVLPGKVRVL